MNTREPLSLPDQKGDQYDGHRYGSEQLSWERCIQLYPNVMQFVSMLLLIRPRHPVETRVVFGQIKANRHFRRSLRRGLNKGIVEIVLVVITYNLMKLL
ncbi:MAG: hypothetical protein ISR87_11200 [Candidatus Marinimicrobia bacterium]|nr:hypothetical protein [Candidatus Neomarinimicrobiota bacterium]